MLGNCTNVIYKLILSLVLIYLIAACAPTVNPTFPQWQSRFQYQGLPTEFWDTDLGGGNIYATGTAGSNLVLAKFDTVGRVIWSTVFEDPLTQAQLVGKSVVIDQYGDIYVAGEHRARKANVASTIESDWLLLKYNAQGSLQWRHQFNGAYQYHDLIVNSFIDQNGNWIVIGTTESPLGAPNQGDVRIASYDRFGVLLWSVNLSQRQFNEELPVARDSLGSIYIATEKISSVGVSTTVLSKIDTAGQMIWEREGGVGVAVDALALDQQDQLVVVYSTLGVGVDVLQGQELGWIEKQDATGTRLWRVDLPNYYHARGLTVNARGTGFLLARTSDTLSSSEASVTDVVLYAFEQNGQLVFERTIHKHDSSLIHGPNASNPYYLGSIDFVPVDIRIDGQDRTLVTVNRWRMTLFSDQPARASLLGFIVYRFEQDALSGKIEALRRIEGYNVEVHSVMQNTDSVLINGTNYTQQSEAMSFLVQYNNS